MSALDDELADTTGDPSGAHPSREQTQTLTTDWHRRTFIREAAIALYSSADVPDVTVLCGSVWAEAKALWESKPEDC